MEPEVFFARLEARLSQPLPGWSALSHMYPAIPDNIFRLKPGYKRSAVIFLLFPEDGSLSFYFLRKPSYSSRYAGHLALPGGEQDEADDSLGTTALRELEEELGIPRTQVRLLGGLTEVYVPHTQHLIFPFVGAALNRPAFVHNPREAEEVISVSFRHLCSDEARGLVWEKHFFGRPTLVPAYLIPGQPAVWGVVAMWISELRMAIAEMLQKT
jgi:8-oxo-dGTP pyrophosphatase MutT (NUDIX family)